MELGSHSGVVIKEWSRSCGSCERKIREMRKYKEGTPPKNGFRTVKVDWVWVSRDDDDDDDDDVIFINVLCQRDGCIHDAYLLQILPDLVGCQFPYFFMQCFNGLILTTSVRLRLPWSPLIAEQSNLNQVLLRNFTVQLVIAHWDQCYTGLIFQYIYHKHQIFHGSLNAMVIQLFITVPRSQKGSDERSQRI